jgi:uncharacterized protein YhhL (DUF1145 family)
VLESFSLVIRLDLRKSSAFDRINVRRLFIYLEDAISAAAKDQLFEFNDEITRTNFVNIVEPFLRDVQAKRGILITSLFVMKQITLLLLSTTMSLSLTSTSNQQDRLTSLVLRLLPPELVLLLKK